MTNETTGPIESLLREIKQILAEISEISVDIRFLRSQAEQTLKQTPTPDGVAMADVYISRCDRLRARSGDLRTRLREWHPRAQNTIAQVRVENLTAREILALNELAELVTTTNARRAA